MNAPDTLPYSASCDESISEHAADHADLLKSIEQLTQRLDDVVSHHAITRANLEDLVSFVDFHNAYKTPRSQNRLVKRVEKLRRVVFGFEGVPYSTLKRARALFDADYYLQSNPDVAATGQDAFEHYIHDGFREGRAPRRDFLATDSASLASKTNPFLAAVDAGWQPSKVDKRAGDSDRQRDVTIAVIAHVFYLEVFEEMLAYMDGVTGVRLYVSCPHHLVSDVEAVLGRRTYEYSILAVENRGRDILPSLKLLQQAEADGFAYFVKVHTKKSLHRKDGEQWRRSLYGRLITPAALNHIADIFSQDPHIGMIGPQGSFHSLTASMGGNEARLRLISNDLGLRWKDAIGVGFFAGSMFAARFDALQPLMGLAFHEHDQAFERESGQLDGTLAHAIERAFSLSVKASCMDVVSTDYRPAISRS